jgi:molybdopterin-guanine dinucleotide biosynthesis protein A
MAALPITGLLFAGGQSSRMGRDKALLPWRGKPLLLHVGQRLAEQVAEVLVLSGPRVYPGVPWAQHADDPPGLGPLGGLLTGLKKASQPWSMAVAVDMPYFHPGLPALLLAHAQGVDAVVPAPFGRPEPLCALYGQTCLPAIEDSLLTGTRRMTAIFTALRVRYLEQAELSSLGNVAQVFANCNTPGEWEQLHGNSS